MRITVNKTNWGREGEMDYCLDFGSMKPDEVNSFIKEAKKVLASSDRINIGENTDCQGTMQMK